MKMANAPGTDRFVAQIMDRDYQLSCTPEEKLALLDAVQMVDERMCTIRDGGKVKSADRIAVMVSLNLAVELLSAKGMGDMEVGELKRKIERINALADEVLSPQEKLF
jgi:cell division protein ZapA